MIHYFYIKGYDEINFPPADQVQLYLVADKYDVPELKKIACENFRLSARQYHDDDPSMLLPAIKLLY